MGPEHEETMRHLPSQQQPAVLTLVSAFSVLPGRLTWSPRGRRKGKNLPAL